jgi:hypothetical protein
VGGCVPEAGERVVDRGRERMLGGQAVVDGEEADAGLAREPAAHRVMGVDVAQDVPAAMEVDEERPRRPRAVGHIEAGRDAAGVEVAYLGQGDRTPAGTRRVGGQRRARLGDVELVVLGAPEPLLQPQHDLDLGLELDAVAADGPPRDQALDPPGQAHDRPPEGAFHGGRQLGWHRGGSVSQGRFDGVGRRSGAGRGRLGDAVHPAVADEQAGTPQQRRLVVDPRHRPHPRRQRPDGAWIGPANGHDHLAMQRMGDGAEDLRTLVEQRRR